MGKRVISSTGRHTLSASLVYRGTADRENPPHRSPGSRILPVARFSWTRSGKSWASLDGSKERISQSSTGFAENKGTERMPELAADLVLLKVDVIVVTDTPSSLAAKSATTTIPIVMTNLWRTPWAQVWLRVWRGREAMSQGCRG